MLAVLDGRMTQYRAPVVFSSPFTHSDWPTVFQTKDGNWGWTDAEKPIPAMLERPGKVCPYGHVGDMLWVREVWAYAEKGEVLYRASETDLSHWEEVIIGPWRSPVQMARSASRLTLEVLGVRPERVLGMTEEDARAEGCHGTMQPDVATSLPLYSAVYRRRWEARYGKVHPWAVNPWVWRVSFRVVAVGRGSRLEHGGCRT